MKVNRPARVAHFRNVLGELLKRPGGVPRDRAISAAMRGIESLRPGMLQALADEVAEVEQIAASFADPLSADEIMELLRREDVIFNLAGTYGYAELRAVAAGLGDLLVEGYLTGNCPQTPVIVHVQAARMFAPHAAPMAESEGATLLGRLAKVRSHVRQSDMRAPREASCSEPGNRGA